MKFGGWQKCSLLDFPGKLSTVLFTAGCSFRCPFCHNPSLVIPDGSPPLSTEEVFSFLMKRKKTIQGVVVSGGEPTIQPDLPHFLEAVRQMGFSIKLDTNGSNPGMVAALLEGQLVDYWAVDRKASLARYHLLAGVHVDPGLIEQSSRLIMASGCGYEFRTTLIREWHSREEIETIGKELTGADLLFLQQFRPSTTLDPAFQKASPYSPEEMGLFCDLVRPYVKACQWR